MIGDHDYWDPVDGDLDDPSEDPRPHCEHGLLCYQKDKVGIKS